jgi:hypothetical protein
MHAIRLEIHGVVPTTEPDQPEPVPSRGYTKG